MDERFENILRRLQGVRRSGHDKAMSRCPAHNDKNASLSLKLLPNGRIILYCHANCSPLTVLRTIGLTWSAVMPPKEPKAASRLVATYDYATAEGELLYQVCRFEPKAFRQRRPDGNDGWIWSLNGTARVLYRLPELVAANPDEPVLIVEGEKDADNLAKRGFVATCNAGGAGKWHTLTDDSVLAGRNVAILPDKDDAGRNHAQDVYARLNGRAASVKIIELPGNHVKDVSDWFSAGGTADELRKLIAAAGKPTVAPVQIDKPPSGETVLGQRDPGTGRIVLSPRQTLPTAEAFVREFFAHPDGPTLWNYTSIFWRWQNNRYVYTEDAGIRQKLLPWLHKAARYVVNRQTGEMELVDFDSNPGTVEAVLKSVQANQYLDKEVPVPSWFGGDPPYDIREIMACKTCNVYVPTETVFPATPRYFTTSALDFDYDPDAPEPKRWLTFLDQLWGHDPEQIAMLQEWFGYCLTPDTRQQKMLMIVGPRRSGKGTIGHVLNQVVGQSNTVWPTTERLGGEFGLQSLIGKTLAIVPDARFSGDKVGVVIERLLSVSGEDRVDINRKFLTGLELRLSTRFMLLSNEIPRLPDSSTALAGRFIILRMNKSFFGHEDTGLLDSLMQELPGILKWAVQGWTRLHERGRFVQPASTVDAAQDMLDLSSPVSAFVRDCCEVRQEYTEIIDVLYRAWRSWCEAEGRGHPTTKAIFLRDLHSAVPGLLVVRNGEQRLYRGLKLVNTTEPPSWT